MKKKDACSSHLDIRYSCKEDLLFLRKWMSKPESLRFLSVEQTEIKVFSENWIGFSRYSSSLTLTLNKEPIGIATLFLMPYLKLIHHSSVYMILDPKMQKEKIARMLIKNINHLAKNYFHFEKVYFETFEGDPLLFWMMKEEYKEVARQKNCVKEENNRYLARLILEKQL